MILYISGILAENHRCIMPAKSKGITKCCSDCTFLGFVKRKIQSRIKSGIIGKMIYSRRDNIVHYGKQSGNGFYCTGSAKKMTCH